MSIGIAIRRIRVALGLTLADLGQIIGVPTPSLSGVEREERPLPELALKKLLAQLRMTQGELDLIGVRNPELILKEQGVGGTVFMTVRQQCAARHELRLKIE